MAAGAERPNGGEEDDPEKQLVSVLFSTTERNNWCQFCFQRQTELTRIIFRELSSDTNYLPFRARMMN